MGLTGAAVLLSRAEPPTWSRSRHRSWDRSSIGATPIATTRRQRRHRPSASTTRLRGTPTRRRGRARCGGGQWRGVSDRPTFVWQRHVRPPESTPQQSRPHGGTCSMETRPRSGAPPSPATPCSPSESRTLNQWSVRTSSEECDQADQRLVW